MSAKFRPGRRCEHVGGGMRCTANVAYEVAADGDQPVLMVCVNHWRRYEADGRQVTRLRPASKRFDAEPTSKS